MDYLREAELKHCRIAMLAIVGFIATDIGVRLPMFEGVSSASAHSIGVEKGALGLVALVASAFEMVSWIAVQEMLQGSGREPGYFGFGSKYLEGKSDEEVKLIKYKELKNGRLAMVSFVSHCDYQIVIPLSFLTLA
jgi:light-harvesting complex I chlorophyll a/b binding protein 1